MFKKLIWQHGDNGMNKHLVIICRIFKKIAPKLFIYKPAMHCLSTNPLCTIYKPALHYQQTFYAFSIYTHTAHCLSTNILSTVYLASPYAPRTWAANIWKENHLLAYCRARNLHKSIKARGITQCYLELISHKMSLIHDLGMKSHYSKHINNVTTINKM